MTMRITVTNIDLGRKLKVQPRSIRLDRNFLPTGEPPIESGKPTLVDPGGSIEVWLHQGLDCVMSEYLEIGDPV